MLDAKLHRNLSVTVYKFELRFRSGIVAMVSQGITRDTPETSTSFASGPYPVPACGWLPRTPRLRHGKCRAQTVGEFCVVGVVGEAGRPQPVLGGPDPLGGFLQVVSASSRIGSSSATLPPAFFQDPRKRPGVY
jgi:hypothetical protein